MNKEEAKCLTFKTVEIGGIECYSNIYYSENKFENAIRKDFSEILQEISEIPHIQSILAKAIPYVKDGYYINCVYMEMIRELKNDSGMGSVDIKPDKYDVVHLTLNQAVKHITIKEMNLIL